MGSEKERWAKSIEKLKGQLNLVVGDVLIASSFVSYAGPFSKRFRNIMIYDEFLKFMKDNSIPTSDDPNPVAILTDDSIVAKWSK